MFFAERLVSDLEVSTSVKMWVGLLSLDSTPLSYLRPSPLAVSVPPLTSAFTSKASYRIHLVVRSRGFPLLRVTPT